MRVPKRRARARRAAREFIEAQWKPCREAAWPRLSWPLVASRWNRLLVLGGVLLVAAFAIAVAVAALDSGREEATRAEYTATVTNTRDRIDFALVRITRSQSEEELIERIDEASTAVGAAGDDLGDAGVARGFENLHDRLVSTLDDFSSELEGTAAQFQDPTFAPNLQGINSLGFLEWENVNKVLADMRKKGLEVDLLERHLAQEEEEQTPG
jgi:hypothetical protein